MAKEEVKKEPKAAKAKPAAGAPKLVMDEKSKRDEIRNIASKLKATTLINERVQVGFIDTSNLALNLICSGKAYGGGIPMGRLTEIFGPSSACKTAFATHMLQGCQAMGGLAVLIDSENAFDVGFAERLGIDPEELIYCKPQTLEGCFDMIVQISKIASQSKFSQYPTLIVYDSIASSPSSKEFEETVEKGVDNKSELGNRAKVCSQKLRIITQLLKDHNIALVIINQLRTNVGVMYGNPETTAGGGKSLEYYGSLRIDLRRRKKIVQEGIERAFGIYVDAKIVKNKVADPYWEAKQMEFFFANGVDPLSGLVEAMIFCGRFIKPTVGWVAPASEPDNKFRAKNIEEWSLTGENYKHLDAESAEQLIAYYARNQAARDAAKSDVYKAVDASDEEGGLSLPLAPEHDTMTD